MRKDVKKIDASARSRIREFMEENIANSDNPRQFGHALKGTLGELWRYRVGDYRILCKISDRTLTILVVKVGHRKEIYAKQ